MPPFQLWAEIEAALAATVPKHSDWREAIRHYPRTPVIVVDADAFVITLIARIARPGA